MEFFPLILLFLVFGLPIILTIHSLQDIIRSTFQDPTNKIIWVIIVLLAPILGSLAYLFWGYKQKTI